MTVRAEPAPVYNHSAWILVVLRTIGSRSLARQLLDAGLVDHLRLLVFPVVLG